MGDVTFTTTAGQQARAYRRGAVAGDPVDQYVIPVRDRIVSFAGRAGTFRQLGIAGTTGQKLLTIFNAVGSTVIVEVDFIGTDLMSTAARVVEQPLLRAHKITTLPTGGTAVTKTAEDSTQTSSASVTILQGTASEGGAATAITATAGNIINQEFGSRLLTATGYETGHRAEWFNNYPWTLRAGEGILVNLDYNTATQNPVTDKWVNLIHWQEYTRP